ITGPKSNPPVEAAAPSAPPGTQKLPSPNVPPQARPSAQPSAAAPVSMPKNGAKLEMDWDDDQEATHVFDKDEKDEKKAAPDASAQALSGPETREPDRASMDAIMSSPPPAPKSGNPPAA